MFLSANEIARTREHALNNFLGLSSAGIEATQRLAELFSATGRDAIAYNQLQQPPEHSQIAALTKFHAIAWRENTARLSRMAEGALVILGEAHKAMIRSAEAQICVFDEIAFASIRRATKSSPWEAELALNAMKSTLQSAEQTLHGVSAAAIETFEIAEQEAHQALEHLAEKKPAPRKRQAARK